MVEREVQTSKLEGKAMQNSSQSSKMKKKLKEVKIPYETSLKNIMQSNIFIIGVPEGEERERVRKII